MRFRTFLGDFNFSRAKWYVPLAVVTSVSYILKKGFTAWVVLIGCVVVGGYLVFVPIGYAIWRRQRLRDGDVDD